MLLSGQRGKAQDSRFRDHLFYIWPIWDGTNTPPGKGHDHLSRTVAQTPESYARTILGGFKLLLLVALWKIVLELIAALIYGDPKSPFSALFHDHTFGLPRVKQIFEQATGVPAGPSMAQPLSGVDLGDAFAGGQGACLGRRDPAVWLQYFSQYLQAAAGANRRRVLEPLLLLFQRVDDGVLLSADLRALLS